jgi:hypothetical protein
MSLESERMRRLRTLRQASPAPMAKPPAEPEQTYVRTWDDDHKPQMTGGIAALAAAQLSSKARIPLEEAMARIKQDFDVLPARIRIHPSTMAHARHRASVDGMAPDDWRV